MDENHPSNRVLIPRKITIQRQLIADVPLCTLLSGGLDSSAITALAARLSDERIRSFAVDFVGYTDTLSPARGAPHPTGRMCRRSRNTLVPTTRTSCCPRTNSWTRTCGPPLSTPATCR
ncbi:asparagine synthase-related protein [Mesorhizobium sp. M0276]|uniref:asparagine synthase-related protein n=1 Tax=Mesorhizobium sp. M0276 TaxID=2956928 RepID=UPI00333CCC15